MIQLIINGVPYPETSIEQYHAQPRDTGIDLEMIAGTTITELGYRKMYIEYDCELIDQTTFLHAMANIYRGNRLDVQYLIPESDELQSGIFILDGHLNRHWGDGDWYVVGFKLRGVNPIA